MPKKPSKPRSLSRQAGLSFSKILLILVSLVLLGLALKWVHERNYFGISTKTITAPMQKINPFKDEFEGFGVQVVATTSLAEAKKVMNKFALDGYSSFIIETSQRGNPLYLVRLGPYTRAEAIAINDKIKRRYKKSPYVRDSFVVYREG